MNKKLYVTPEMEELEMKLMGMIAASGNDVDDPGYSDDPVPEPFDPFAEN